MTVDPVGVGAVLLHITPDRSAKPIYFTSRTLSRVEWNYAQIELEGIGDIFGVSKFYKYIYGREFTIITDHKPLLGLFKEDGAVSPTGSAMLGLGSSELPLSASIQTWLKISNID